MNLQIHYRTLLIFALLVTVCFGEQVVVESSGSKLILEIVAFDPQSHNIDRLATENLIDGMFAFGVDCMIPATEVVSMVVETPGDTMIVPDSLFIDCFEISARSDIDLLVSREGSVLIYISASDGAGSYAMAWCGMRGCFDRFEDYELRIKY